MASDAQLGVIPSRTFAASRAGKSGDAVEWLVNRFRCVRSPRPLCCALEVVSGNELLIGRWADLLAPLPPCPSFDPCQAGLPMSHPLARRPWTLHRSSRFLKRSHQATRQASVEAPPSHTFKRLTTWPTPHHQSDSSPTTSSESEPPKLPKQDELLTSVALSPPL